MAKANAEDRCRGRREAVDKLAIRKLRAEGLRPTDIASRVGVARSTVYEALKVPAFQADTASPAFLSVAAQTKHCSMF
ncbi:helix-turn-helix domain-containing protein [Brevundimonas sp.]|uniref:helix-turn-helix domain-containing protein n=1 Tax=Brevundimonas sp. TaxID=1871086 RepID=UPI003918571A